MLRGAGLVAAVLGVGCAHVPKPSDTRSREEFQVSLHHWIPPGTPAIEALATLKKDGFDCGITTNKSIPDLGLDGPVPEETGDFIYAERVEKCLPFLVLLFGEYRWRVVLILKDGVVDRYRTYLSLSG